MPFDNLDIHAPEYPFALSRRKGPTREINAGGFHYLYKHHKTKNNTCFKDNQSPSWVKISPLDRENMGNPVKMEQVYSPVENESVPFFSTSTAQNVSFGRKRIPLRIKGIFNAGPGRPSGLRVCAYCALRIKPRTGILITGDFLLLVFR